MLGPLEVFLCLYRLATISLRPVSFQDLLAKSEVPSREQLSEELSLVHRNALRLLKLVNNLLDFSKIEAGGAQAQFRPVDLVQLTRDLASTFRSATTRYPIRCL